MNGPKPKCGRCGTEIDVEVITLAKGVRLMCDACLSIVRAESGDFPGRDANEVLLLDYLGRQAGVEIHIADTAFFRGGKVRVFWRGDEVAENDDIRRALNAAIKRITRLREEKEHKRECFL